MVNTVCNLHTCSTNFLLRIMNTIQLNPNYALEIFCKHPEKQKPLQPLLHKILTTEITKKKL